MAKAKDATVKVILNLDTDPPFHLQSSLLQGDRLVFSNDHHPGFDVYFTIEDPHNSGYLFPKNEKKALSAKEYKGATDACPDQGVDWSQFSPVDVSTDFKTLHVRNLNQFETAFGFSLFVTTTPQNPNAEYLKLDPIGDNRNGPVMSSSFSWTYVAIGVAAVAILALVAYQFGLLRF